MVEESSLTIDDGCWAWQSTENNNLNILSTRHNSQYLDITDAAGSATAGNGNVLFCDGHSDWIPRIDSYNPIYYDPTK
jgi:prepilin-type processing-associated H-X9-DG protein